MLCLRSAYAVLASARRSTSRIIFITDLNSDHCNADDPDDAEFLQQVCCMLKVFLGAFFFDAEPSLLQLTPALRDHGITLECHFIPRPDASPEDAARAATARHALQSVVQNVGGTLCLVLCSALQR